MSVRGVSTRVRDPGQPRVGQPGRLDPQQLAFGRRIENAGQVDGDRDGAHHVPDHRDRCRHRHVTDLPDLLPLPCGDSAAHPGQLPRLHQVALLFERQHRTFRPDQDVVGGPVVGLDRADRVQPGRHRGAGQQGESGHRHRDHQQQRQRPVPVRPPLRDCHPKHRPILGRRKCER
jgi:hypothetical protein